MLYLKQALKKFFTKGETCTMLLTEGTGQKAKILAIWFEEFLRAYPPETARYFSEVDQRFSNPVGYTVYHSLAGIFEALCEHKDPAEDLKDLIQVRAVQELVPSKALAFLPELKRIVREELAPKAAESTALSEELEVFDAAIDRLVLQAFDIYSSCRENIYDLKVKETVGRVQRILDRWTAVSAGYDAEELDSKA